jgi:DNA-binding GntR family transcriptional regulator
MGADTAIARGVLSDAVKERLLEGILDGTYAPGSRIVETRVARELGTSQAPVREALRDLEALGVVEISPFRGARVRRPSLDELLEAYVIRAELESLAARLAVPGLADDEHAGLGALLDEMLRCAADGDTIGEAAADAAFHAWLVDRAGNGTLRRLWGQLEPYSRTYINMAVPGGDRRLMAELHRPVLDAVRSGDPGRAEAAIREHFATARRSLADRWMDPAPAATRTRSGEAEAEADAASATATERIR